MEKREVNYWLVMQQLVSQEVFDIRSLGDAGGPIPLLTLRVENPTKRVLIASGFHGLETGSMGALLNWCGLVSNPKYSEEYRPADGTQVSVIPVVSPSAYKRRTQRNAWNEDPADGYADYVSPPTNPSREGRILLAHLDELKAAAADGYIEMHDEVPGNRGLLSQFKLLTADPPKTVSRRERYMKMLIDHTYGTELKRDAANRNLLPWETDNSLGHRLLREAKIPICLLEVLRYGYAQHVQQIIGAITLSTERRGSPAT